MTSWHTLAICTLQGKAVGYASDGVSSEKGLERLVVKGRDLQRELTLAGFTGLEVRIAHHATRRFPNAVNPSVLPPR